MYTSIPISLSNSKVLNVKIKKNKRVKHLWLKADVYGLYAVVPLDYSIEKIHNFIESKKKWILKTSEYYRRLREGYGEGNLRKRGRRRHHQLIDVVDSERGSCQGLTGSSQNWNAPYRKMRGVLFWPGGAANSRFSTFPLEGRAEVQPFVFALNRPAQALARSTAPACP